MPLVVIITAANTASRASDPASGPPETIIETISATSITVTAPASTSDPNGSPTRCATTSAWCTAASTAPTSTIATSSAGTAGSDLPQLTPRTSIATTGTTVVQARRGWRIAVTTVQRRPVTGLSPPSCGPPAAPAGPRSASGPDGQRPYRAPVVDWDDVARVALALPRTAGLMSASGRRRWPVGGRAF